MTTELRGLGYPRAQTPTHPRGPGCLRVQTTGIARWRELTVGALGFAEGTGPVPGGLYLRMDERSARVIVLPGETDQVQAVGWEVRDQFALAAVTTAVEAAGGAVKALPAAECADRRVEQAITFLDPAGVPVEVFFGPLLDHSPVVGSLGQRFVTGPQGLGHVVLPTTAMEETVAFYTEVLGFLPRGAMRVGPAAKDGSAARIRF